MGRPRILDEKLLKKIAKKLNKANVASINVIVSKRAGKLGISSEAALVLLAKEHEIGTSTYQRSLDDTTRGEIRDALPAMATSVSVKSVDRTKTVRTVGSSGISKKAALKLMIEYLLQDDELRVRCSDLLMARSKFDRPINQATLVLEDRIRTKAKPTTKMVGETLVNHAFRDDLAKTILEVPGGNSDEQRGFVQILRGLFPTFRNPTHHHVVDIFTQEDAIRVCAFIDVLLKVIDGSTKIR